MASDLMLPQGLAPSNLHLKPSVKARFVEYDVFNIADRIGRELDGGDRIHIWELSEDRQEQKWLVTENGPDGVERFVCKTDELDARLIEHLQYLVHIPFHVRVAALEAANEEWEQQQHEAEVDRIVEKIGYDMHRELWNCGFISHRGTSYPTKAIKPTRD